MCTQEGGMDCLFDLINDLLYDYNYLFLLNDTLKINIDVKLGGGQEMDIAMGWSKHWRIGCQRATRLD